MTAKEAIKSIQYRIDTASEIAGKGEDGKAFEDLEMAIQVLKEIDHAYKYHTYENCHNLTCRTKCKKDGWNEAAEKIISQVIQIVYEANDREKNPQPRDMVAYIHYKLLELEDKMIKEV